MENESYQPDPSVEPSNPDSEVPETVKNSDPSLVVKPKKSKSKIFVITLLVLALLGLAGGLYYVMVYKKSTKQTASSGTSPAPQTTAKAAGQYVFIEENLSSEKASESKRYIRKINLVTNKLESFLDGSSASNYSYQYLRVSPSGDKIVKVVEKEVFISDSATDLKFSKIFPTDANEVVPASLAVAWTDDGSGLIVISSKSTGTQVPVTTNTIYRLDLTTKKAVKLFDDKQTYGGITAYGTNVVRDEAYFYTEGEGGLRDALIIRKLSDGTLIKTASSKLDSDTMMYNFIKGDLYYPKLTSSATDFRADLTQYKVSKDTSEIIYGTPHSPATTAQDGNRGPGYSITQKIIPGASENTIIFSQVSWAKGKSTTTVYELNTETKKSKSLYELKDTESDVEVTPLLAVNGGVLANSYCNLCSADKTNKLNKLVYIKNGVLTEISVGAKGTSFDNPGLASY